MNTTFWMGETMVTVKARDDAEIVKALREIVTRKDSRYRIGTEEILYQLEA